MGRVVIIGPETNMVKRVLAAGTVAYVTPCASSASLQAELLEVPCHDAATRVRMSEQSIRIPATRKMVQATGVALYTTLPRDFLAVTNWTALREVPVELATAVVLAIACRVHEVAWYGRRCPGPLALSSSLEACLRRRGLTVRCIR